MKKAVLISFQLWNSKRKAGFHHIASSFLHSGYEVLFITGSASRLSYIKGDYRTPLIKSSPKNKLTDMGNGLKTFIGFTNIHPVNMRNKFLNSVISPLFLGYSNALNKHKELNEFVKSSDIIMFESFPGLMWFEHFKKVNHSAKFVYRVSDDIEFQNQHPLILKTEKEIAGKFDLISVPSEYIYNKFSHLKNVRLHLHGIDKDKFDVETGNPYKGEKNFVFTGNSYFDYDFLEIASVKFPEINFHLIGSIEKKFDAENIMYHGELIFEETIPYIKFADAGLHNLTYSKGSESFSDSLKVIQYTYCRLPVIVPEFIKSSRNNFIYYKPRENKSIIEAVQSAITFNKDIVDAGEIYSWDTLTQKLISE